jgi:hypothetical protein
MRGGGPKALELVLPSQARESGNVPFSFWQQIAVDLFKTPNELYTLLVTCNEWKVLLETPMTGFAAYMVATLGKFIVICQIRTSGADYSSNIQHALSLDGSRSSYEQRASIDTK